MTKEDNIIPVDIPDDVRKKIELINYLMEPCDRISYGRRLDEVSQKLNCSRRTVQRMVKKWEQEGINGLFSSQRADKGLHRIDQCLVDFIRKQYIEGNRGGTKVNRSQIAVKAQVKAKQEGLEVPSHMTVYRILQTIIDEQAVKKNVRNPGWKGSKLSLRTKDGTILEPEYSNHVWQCDHTEADILLIDSSGKVFKRPWLTTVIDTYSRCIVGINLGFDAPSSMVVGLALRHAILPKDYPSDYQLHEQWGTYGKPEYIFTDSGTDFKSHHVQQNIEVIDKKID